MERKEHLVQQGLEKILSLKVGVNRGLSESLKLDFPNIVPISLTPEDDSSIIINPNLLAGFVDAESSFMLLVQKSSSNKSGVQFI